jgi:predicted DNA-binding WGR domain protein
MSRVQWTHDPRGVRGRGGVRVENLALVPASLLPHKPTYQALANRLPQGAVLVVLPTEEGAERQLLETAAARFRAKGHPVATITADEVLTQARTPTPATDPAPLPAPDTPLPAPSLTPAESTAVPPAAVAEAALAEPPVVPPFARELRLVSIDAGRNRARFYVLKWQPTLWPGVALVRVWGRLGSRGRAQVVHYAPQPQLDAVVTRLVRRRLQHGYQLVDWH